MPVFKYQALNKDSQKTKGLVEAPNEDSAGGILRDRGLDVMSIQEDKGGKGKKKQIAFGRIKPKDIVVFSRQFSVLISASVSLVQSLQLLVEQTANIKFKEVIATVVNEVDAGEKLSNSLEKHPKVFSQFYVSVVKAGESSGKLDEVLDYLADELEKDYDMTSKIKGAMIYPAFVFSSLIGVGVLMMVFVVPKLTDIMTETGGELPMATKILIAVSDFLVNFWWLLAILLVGAIVGLKFAFKFPAAKRIVDIIILRLPVFGRLFNLIYIVRFTRSLQTLIVGGVSISKGLKISSDVVSNSVYKEMIDKTRQEVEDGNPINTVFVASKNVPPMVAQMIGIGEKTGKLDIILSHISEFYSREINNMVANLMTLMEPIIMVVMGVAVGIMVAAVIMPMYNMATQF